MLEDPPLNFAQLTTWLQPQLVTQSRPRFRIKLERVRLSPTAVEREHRLRLQSLAQRLLGGDAA